MSFIPLHQRHSTTERQIKVPGMSFVRIHVSARTFSHLHITRRSIVWMKTTHDAIIDEHLSLFEQLIGLHVFGWECYPPICMHSDARTLWHRRRVTINLHPTVAEWIRMRHEYWVSIKDSSTQPSDETENYFRSVFRRVMHRDGFAAAQFDIKLALCQCLKRAGMCSENVLCFVDNTIPLLTSQQFPASRPVHYST